MRSAETNDSKSPRRASAVGWLPRSAKRVAGRRTAPLGPAHIRVEGIALETDDRAYIRQKLGMKLGKFATSIQRISVRVRDVNGPRGGVDRSCRIKVVLIGLPSLVVERQQASLRAALDGAVTGAERAVRRSVQRRRMQPIRRRRERDGPAGSIK
jgi:hypothetical protein